MQITYSLPRLIKNWQSLREKTGPIQVGGVVGEIGSDQIVLTGQGVSARLKVRPSEDLQVGATVLFACEFKNLQVDPQLSSLEASEISHFEVLISPRAGDQVVFSSETAKLWDDFLAQVRAHLRTSGLIEVQTPSLVVNSGMEPHLEPFVTEWVYGSRKTKLPLLTSPELHLKKLLCHGFTDIFEIKTCYRNQELTDIHEAEFLMLEWYRAFAGLELIQSDLEDLIEKLKPGTAIRITSFQELFRSQFGFTLEPETGFQELKELAKKHSLDVSPATEFDDIFHLIVSFLLEPKFKAEEATFVYGFPPSQAALAKIGPDGFAQRFELYWQGLEIANAFHELNDPQVQRQRHLMDQKKRLELGRTPLPLDEQFLKSLEKGLPPSGGIALGLDRLFMAVYGIPSIQQTRAFSARAHLSKE